MITIGRAHEGKSRNAKGHTRAAKGTEPLGERLERTLDVTMQ